MRSRFITVLALVFAITIIAVLPGAAAPLAAPCAPGASYDPACDVDHDGDVDIFDIQLTASRWNQTGAWLSDNNHSHLGQTWTGSSNPLKLTGANGAPDYAPLVLSNTAGDGLSITSAADNGVSAYSTGDNGVFVGSAGGDGVHVNQVGSPSITAGGIDRNGFEVGGAEGNGLWVGRADEDGVYVGSAGNDGVYVGRADSSGVEIHSAGYSGVQVVSSDHFGVLVGTAGTEGVGVGSAGDTGVGVSQAGDTGVEVGTAGNYGMRVGSAGINGFHVDGAGAYGLYIGSSAVGAYVYAASDIGVYANVTNINHEWGFSTPDKIYAGTALASNGPLMLVAQSGDSDRLETGDLVVVNGTGTVLGESESPTPLVRRAVAGDDSVIGVVYRRFVTEEKMEEIERNGQDARRTSLQTNSTDGPVASGDFLLVVVLGPTRVKAAPGESAISAGMRLTVAADGGVRPLQTRTVEGMVVSEGAPVIGVAMGRVTDGLVWVLVNPQ